MDKYKFYEELKKESSYNNDYVGTKTFYGIILMKYIDKENGDKCSNYSFDELYLKRSPVNLKYEDLV